MTLPASPASVSTFHRCTVLLTGATGFLGRHTLRALLLAGHRVIAVGREADAAEGINAWAQDEGFSVSAFPKRLGSITWPGSLTNTSVSEQSTDRSTVLGWARLDLSDMSSIGLLVQALRHHGDVDTLVHCAGKSDGWAPAAMLKASNVDLTRHMAMLVQMVRIPRVVYVSTPSVAFASRNQAQQDEFDPVPERPISAYAKSKWQAEQSLMDLLRPKTTNARGLLLNILAPEGSNDALAHGEAFVPEVVIVRPRGLVGAGDTSVVPKMLSMARRGVLPVVNQGEALIDLTSVENVAQAIAHLATTQDPAPFELSQDGQERSDAKVPAYHLTNGEAMRILDVFEVICLNHDVSPRHCPMPYVVLDRIGALCERVAERLHAWSLGAWRWNPPMSRYGAAMLAFDHTLSTARAQAWGYRPTVRLGESLHHHTAWQRACLGQSNQEAIRLSLVHAADLPRRAPRQTDPMRIPSSHVNEHQDPVDERWLRMAYGQGCNAYGSGALNNEVVWVGIAEHTEEAVNGPLVGDENEGLDEDSVHRTDSASETTLPAPSTLSLGKPSIDQG